MIRRDDQTLRSILRAGGFSMVELIIVIGIVVALVALLLPAVFKARKTAGGLTCESNLRQWGMATISFANRNYSSLPRRGQGVGPTFQIARPTDWFNALPPLLNLPPYVELVSSGSFPRPPGGSVWLCPQANDMAGQYYWSYAMNMGLSVWEANQNNGQPDKITNVGDTSTLVLFADAPGNYCSVFPSKQAGGYNPVPRHGNNLVNICFLDGHVEPMPGSYIGCGTGLIEHPDIRWHPPKSTWNGAQ
jgi:prepilin-type processing-associated H-X9-DG protein